MDVAPKDLSQIATAMATIGMTEACVSGNDLLRAVESTTCPQERFFASLARASVARCERFSVEALA